MNNIKADRLKTPIDWHSGVCPAFEGGRLGGRYGENMPNVETTFWEEVAARFRQTARLTKACEISICMEGSRTLIVLDFAAEAMAHSAWHCPAGAIDAAQRLGVIDAIAIKLNGLAYGPLIDLV